MFTSKYLLPAVAVIGLAVAQTSICNQATATINSQADATALAASCSTVNGAISIGSTVVGAISLDGIQQIKGDLSVIGAVNMTGLSGKDLNSIGGTMRLNRLTILSNLGFPQLTSVLGLDWQVLNALQQLGFTTGLRKAGTVLISDTQLTTLDGINLEQVESIDINNNPYLGTFRTQIANITKSLNINANAANLQVEFPNLLWAQNMTLRNISSISIPLLQNVTTTFGFYDSLNLAEIKAPNLTLVGGDVAFINNPTLFNISMPVLKTVGGGVTVQADKSLLTIDGFPSLKTTGAINMSGNFTTALLPVLTDCKGTFNMQSSGNISCDPFSKYHSSKVIKGDFTCTSASTDVQNTVNTGGSGTSSGAAPSGTKGAAPISSVDMPAVMGFSAFVGALVQMLL